MAEKVELHAGKRLEIADRSLGWTAQGACGEPVDWALKPDFPPSLPPNSYHFSFLSYCLLIPQHDSCPRAA